MNQKQYGLILPASKRLKGLPSRPGGKTKNVFSDANLQLSSDEEGDCSNDGNQVDASTFKPRTKSAPKSTDWIKASMDIQQSKMKRQTKLDLSKALEEDSSIFQYDEIYDEIKQNKKPAHDLVQEEQGVKAEKKMSKYTGHLLQQAKRRETERQHRLEKQVERERETEGDKFDDKEVFVTNAYKQKMAELQQVEEEQRQKLKLEDMLDVRKQKDLSGFYRHLYRDMTDQSKKGDGQIMTGDVQKKMVQDTTHEGKVKKIQEKRQTMTPKDIAMQMSPDSDETSHDQGGPDLEPVTTKIRKRKTTAACSYRNRHAAPSSDSDSEEPSDREMETESVIDIPSRENEANKLIGENNEGREIVDDSEVEANVDGGNSKEEVIVEDEDATSRLRILSTEEKLAIYKDKWQKLTVSEKFESALGRFYRRKSAWSSFPWTKC